MSTQTAGVAHAETDPRARAAALLSRYPDLSETEFGRLHHWFKREAGPLDVGLLASDPAIAEQYQAYRKEHHDRFSARDMGMAALFVAIVACAIGIIVLMMP